jgi:hypothetical protein
VIDRHDARVIVRPDSIDIEFREPILASEPLAVTGAAATVISLPWTAQAFPSVKRVLHRPEAKPTLKQKTRDAILLAIAKARSWIDEVASGCVRSAGATRFFTSLSEGLKPLGWIPKPSRLVETTKCCDHSEVRGTLGFISEV